MTPGARERVRRLTRLTRGAARVGEAAASLAGLECVTERSPGSESVYLHVRHTRRGGESAWRGLRISCHAPSYECCHDYEQFLLPRAPTLAELRGAAVRLQGRVRSGGRAVADPRRVADAIDRLAHQLSDGRVYRDAAGRRWRWDAGSSNWSPVGPRPGKPPRHNNPPRHSGTRALSPRVRCNLRHAMNAAAAWAAEFDASPAR